MNKPEKPNITIPESFAVNGVKADFDSNKVLNGFDRLQPDVLAGDNLNKFIDDTYKGLNYALDIGDYIEEGIANTNLSNLSSEGQAKFDAKVNKSGDTMTGTLTVEADGQYTRTIAMKSKTIDISTNASLTSNDGLYFVDKNGIAICWCVIQQENGTKNTALSVGYNASQNPNFLGFNFPKATTKATTVSTASAYKPAVVVQNYVNGTSWYRVWSDGWIEQGGRITGNHPTVTLLKNFSNTNYTAFAIQTGDGEYDSNIRVHTITTSGFIIYCNNYTGEKIWYACGY